MRIKNLDLWLGFLLDGVALILIPAGVLSGLASATIGVLIVCFIPGSMIVSALFPKQRGWRVWRVTLSIGISFAVTIIGGLILDVTSWGIQRDSLLMLNSMVIAIAGIGALARRDRVPTIKESWSISLRHAFLLAVATAMSLAAMLLVYTDGQTGPGFTQLSMLKEDRVLRIGVTSHEHQPMNYRLVVVKGSEILYHTVIDILPSERHWEVDLPIPTSSGKVETFLYRADIPGRVYRLVSAWIDSD